MASNEVELMKLFLGSYRNPNVRLFRRQVINKTMQDLHTGAIHQVKAGIVGQADVYGFVKGPTTRPLEIEFKAHRGVLSNQQQQWQLWCQQWGVTHLILRSDITEKPHATLYRWTCELNDIVSAMNAK